MHGEDRPTSNVPIWLLARGSMITGYAVRDVVAELGCRHPSRLTMHSYRPNRMTSNSGGALLTTASYDSGSDHAITADGPATTSMAIASNQKKYAWASGTWSNHVARTNAASSTASTAMLNSRKAYR